MSETRAFLTVAEVAALLRVKPHVVYDWCRDGELLAIRVGRLWRIDRPALEYLIASGGIAQLPMAGDQLVDPESVQAALRT